MPTPRERLPGERIFALLMLVFSAFMLWSSFGISGFKSTTSAGAFPMAASATMLVCSLIALVQTLKAPAAVAQPGETALLHFRRRVAPGVIVWTTVAIFGYMLTLEWLGFIVSSYLYLLVNMRILGERRWGISALASALVLAAIYVVFQTAFSVVLPAGSLWQGVFK